MTWTSGRTGIVRACIKGGPAEPSALLHLQCGLLAGTEVQGCQPWPCIGACSQGKQCACPYLLTSVACCPCPHNDLHACRCSAQSLRLWLLTREHCCACRPAAGAHRVDALPEAAAAGLLPPLAAAGGTLLSGQHDIWQLCLPAPVGGIHLHSQGKWAGDLIKNEGRVLLLNQQCARAPGAACTCGWPSPPSTTHAYAARAGAGYEHFRTACRPAAPMNQKKAGQIQTLILLQWSPLFSAVWLPVLMQSCHPASLCLCCGPHATGPFCKQHALTLVLLPHMCTQPISCRVELATILACTLRLCLSCTWSA